MKKFEAQAITIEQLINMKFYKLHIGQRRYEWDIDLIEYFIQDIRDNTEDEEGKYFIGTTVLIEEMDKEKTKSLSVIDGQQRLTTILLIIASIKEKFEQLQDTETDNRKKKELQKCTNKLEGYLLEGDVSENGIIEKYRLKISDNDNDIFKKLLSNENIDPTEITTSSHEKLIDAKSKITEIISTLNARDLTKFMHALLKRVEIIEMKTTDESTAYILFENINRRLQELEPSDLIKNMFLKNVSSEKERNSLSEKWDRFINILTPSQKNRNKFPASITPSNFLKHYIMSKGIYINKKGIYDHFNDLELMDDEVNSTLDDLNDKANKYINFLKGMGSSSIKNIKDLGLKQAVIVLLAASNLQQYDFDDICSLVENVAFCYVIGELRTNKLEKHFTDIAKEISENKIDEAKKLLKNLISENEETVLYKLQNKQFNTTLNKKRAKYILLKVAKLLDGGDYEDLTIEHIMPEAKSQHWEYLSNNKWYSDDESYKKIISNIGNLALLTKNDNSSIKGNSFNEKCQVYRDKNRLTSSVATPIITNTVNTVYDRILAECVYSTTTKWGHEEIIERAKWITKLAKYIWFGYDIPQ